MSVSPIERPILFSAPMVRAILEGRKTQTRRVVKPQPQHPSFGSRKMLALDDEGVDLYLHGGPLLPRAIRCPYGRDGHRLWVRETWAAPHSCDHLKPVEIDRDWRIHYAATEERGGLRWRPSIHMPRWASRIQLEITEVRVERLQEISENDALAEGVETWAAGAMSPEGQRNYSAVGKFEMLWSSINGDDSWRANPWVWVVSFRRITE